MGQLQAGIATVDITPPVGTWLAGFAGRYKGSEGIHDPLRARALVLDDGDTRLLIITCDILSLAYPFIDDLKARIEAESGLPPERVMVNCSHTHSGPVTRTPAADPSEGDCYMLNLPLTLLGAVKMALADLRPSRIGSARTDVQIGINRRERIPGGTKLGRNPDLPVAPYVDVVRIDDMAGNPRAILFSHACHPVTRASDNYQISADFPGRAQEVVESVFPGVQAMFAQGCAGNINSEPCGGSFEDVHRLGTVLGGAVIKAAAGIETQCETRLAAAMTPTVLPLQEAPPVDVARERLEAANRAVEEAEASGDPGRVKSARSFADWNQRVYDLAKSGATNRVMRYDMQAFALGEVGIVGLPGEVFVEYQLNIAARSPFAQTLVFGVTNGCPSYIPTAAEYPHGGYEVLDAIRFYGDTMIDPGLEPIILDAAHELLVTVSA